MTMIMILIPTKIIQIIIQIIIAISIITIF